MNNYFRITAYYPKTNQSMIMDSYGLFEKLWEFSADLVKKGFKIIEVGNSEKFLDGNFEKVNEQMDKYILRADMKGMPNNTTYAVNGTCYKAIEVEGHIYIPDKNKLE